MNALSMFYLADFFQLCEDMFSGYEDIAARCILKEDRWEVEVVEEEEEVVEEE